MAGAGDIPVQTDKDAAATASLMMATVVSYGQALQTLAASLRVPTITPVFPTLPAPPQQNKVTQPTLLDITWDVPAQPAGFTGTLDISRYLPGPFNGIAPTLNFGTQPTQFSGTIPSAPPINYNYVYPTVDVTLPSPPTLLTIKDLQFTPLSIPTFNGIVPTLEVYAPSVIPFVEGASYASTELALVQAEIASALTSDTDIGLSAVVQQAMWDAAREREYRQMADALDALTRDAEVLGYAFPPGTFNDSRIKLQTEMQYTTAGISRDIMVKQADLRLQNVTKARELAITLESKLIDYYNERQQRSFDCAKYITEAQVSIYNGQVQAYTAQIEGYKASIEAFNAAIRGVELYIDQLKAEIAFEQTKAEINTAIVNQYKTEVDAAEAQIEVYKIQVEIINTEAQVEKLKVDTYGVQIQAFAATVNAYTAEIEGYKALVDAQGTIESVFKTQVDAYAAQVNAGVSAANALVAVYDGEIKAYEAQLDGYKASLQAMVEKVKAASEYNQSEVAAYTAEVQAVVQYNQVLNTQWEQVVKVQEDITQIAIKAAEVNGQMYVATQNLIIEADKTGITAAAQMGAAALNALHYSNNSNWSFNESLSTSLSTSTSTSDNTNHNESV